MHIPWGAKTVIPNHLFIISIKRRLGLPILSKPSVCSYCNSHMDVFADHAVVCKKKGGIIRRHNGLRNLIFELASLAKLNPKMERKGIIGDNPNLRPGDVEIPNPLPDPVDLVDVAVHDAMATSFFSENPLLREEADFSPADSYAEKVKLPKYAGMIPDGYRYLPVVWDSYGGVNSVGEQFLSRLFVRLAQNNVWSLGPTIMRSWQLVSSVLQCGVATQIKERALLSSHHEFHDVF
jgi:hypothetical protein